MRAAGSLVVSMVAVAAASAAPVPDTVVARVGDESITLAAVDARCGGACAKLRREILERKWAMVETLVGEALLAGHPPPAPGPVEEDDVDRFLEEHAADFHGPPERDRTAVRFYLERERRRAAEAEQIAAERSRQAPVLHVARDDQAWAATANADLLVAEVDGRRILDRDVEERLALALYRLRGALARERRRHLDALVDEALWRQEAAARGQSVAALQREVRAGAARVTDADVDRYFDDAVRAREPDAEKHPERLRPYLEFRAAHAAEEAFLVAARAHRDVRTTLAEPRPPRLPLGAGSGGWHGPPDAPARVVFLTSYRGSGSRMMWAVVRALAAEPETALAVRPLLPQWDPEATAVASAVRCAGAAGKGLAFHDAAASAPALPERAALDRMARTVGLDPRAFAACMADPATAAAVAAESAEAERLGLDEPPAVLINGRVFGGVQSAGRLRAVARRARRDAARTP